MGGEGSNSYALVPSPGIALPALLEAGSRVCVPGVVWHAVWSTVGALETGSLAADDWSARSV
jgi:hypothetical protein